MDKVDTAIARLQMAAEASEKYYNAPLLMTTSGGKDSSACVQLAIMAGIDFEIIHSHTTADAPETVRFVREEFKRLEALDIPCTLSYPTYKGKPTSMWSLIPLKLMPPTRVARYCCSVLKEQGGKGRYICTGVRWAESAQRKKRGIYEIMGKTASQAIVLNNDNDESRRLFEACYRKKQAVVNPIIDWSDNEVWDFIHAEKIPVNPLYACGFTRVGCIGCPLAGRKSREYEFSRYPKYREMYISAFDRMLQERERRGKTSGDWVTGVDVYHWWLQDGVLAGQIEMDDDYDDEL